jgi:hypothetical protein
VWKLPLGQLTLGLAQLLFFAIGMLGVVAGRKNKNNCLNNLHGIDRVIQKNCHWEYKVSSHFQNHAHLGSCFTPSNYRLLPQGKCRASRTTWGLVSLRQTTDFYPRVRVEHPGPPGVLCHSVKLQTSTPGYVSSIQDHLGYCVTRSNYRLLPQGTCRASRTTWAWGLVSLCQTMDFTPGYVTIEHWFGLVAQQAVSISWKALAVSPAVFWREVCSWQKPLGIRHVPSWLQNSCHVIEQSTHLPVIYCCLTAGGLGDSWLWQAVFISCLWTRLSKASVEIHGIAVSL